MRVIPMVPAPKTIDAMIRFFNRINQNVKEKKSVRKAVTIDDASKIIPIMKTIERLLRL